MSEPGEIPAEEPSKAKDEEIHDAKDKEDGEVVVATAVVEENDDDEDESAGSDVVAKVVDDEPAQAATSKPTAASSEDAAHSEKKSDDAVEDEEEGAIPETKETPKAISDESAVTAPTMDKNEEKAEAQPEEKTKEESTEERLPTTLTLKKSASMDECDIPVTKDEVKEPNESTKPESPGDGTATEEGKTATKEKPSSAIDTTENTGEETAPNVNATNRSSNKIPEDKTPIEDDKDGEAKEDAEDGEVNEDNDAEDGVVKDDKDAVDGEIKDDKDAEDGEMKDDQDAEGGEMKDVEDAGESEMKEDGEIEDEKVTGNSAGETKDQPPQKPKSSEKVEEDEKVEKTDAVKGEKAESEDVTMAEEKNTVEKTEPVSVTGPMEVDGEKPKENESTNTGTTTSAKKGAAKKAEDGEVKEDTEEEGEIKEEMEEEGEIKDDTEEEGEIKEDVEMEDAFSQSEEGGDRDIETASVSADADTASVDGDADSVVDDAKKVEPSYSTRGRASGTTTPVPRDTVPSSKGSAASGGSNDQWERSVREALEDLGRTGKEAPPAGVGPGGASFLEALGEEERRTRTRYLPAVEGIHMLRKNEIKGDLALARSIISSAGNVTSVAILAAGRASSSTKPKKDKGSKKKHDSSSGEGDAMDTDDGDLSAGSEDDPAADGVRIGSSATIKIEDGNLLVVPSTAFVPPPAATDSSASTAPASNGEKKEDGAPAAPVLSTGVKGILNNQRNMKSPKVVESVTAFNPPRPPESVGKKKQHRMLRWERRPTDVEVDLNNYRKTVDRTRKELHTAEDELERIETTSNHLRTHFFSHLRCMDQEFEQITSELNAVQQQCVTAADLLTSRTRSRGAGKGSYVMRDVMTVLKQRGAEISEKGFALRSDSGTSTEVFGNCAGFGGVGASSFGDWNHQSAIKPHSIASSWVLPDDKVDTPYGQGVVVKIFEKAALNVNEPPYEATLLGNARNGESPAKMDVDPPSGSPSATKRAPGKKICSSGSDGPELSKVLGPRICVRLPFGIAYFSPAAVTSKASPHAMSDAQLAKRWRGLIGTALSQSSQLDLEGMAWPIEFSNDASEVGEKAASDESAGAANGASTSMDIDENRATGPDSTSKKVVDPSVSKLLPFGSGLFPTGTGRGNMLYDIEALQLQRDLKPVLTENGGVLGDQANEGVPSEVKDFEANRQECYTLQAKVLHLRNQLYRQRRIRSLNERTLAATRDRSSRVESLVAEMRTDLKSLKNRLDEELNELGINYDRAEAILKAYYLSREYGGHEVDDDKEHDGATSQKRSRDGSGDCREKQGTSSSEGPQTPDSDMARQTKRTKVAAQ